MNLTTCKECGAKGNIDPENCPFCGASNIIIDEPGQKKKNKKILPEFRLDEERIEKIITFSICTIIIGGIIAIMIFMISACSDDSNSYEGTYRGNSYKYYTDREYRKNVDTIAEAYGKSPQEVERMGEAIANAMNK